MKPKAKLDAGEMNPEAGVTQTRPITAPAQKPFRDIFLVLCIIISIDMNVRPPTLAARLDTTPALTLLAFIEASLPPIQGKIPIS